MATKFNFNGKLITLPGVYTQTKGAVNNGPIAASYGNVLIIDDTAAPEFGGGSGISGTINSGLDSVYQFDNIGDFRDFVRGGELWDLAKPLFKPYSGANGISNLFYVRAITTVAPTLTLTFTNGSLVIKCRAEGTCGNGVEASSVLTKGFCATLSAGTIDSNKFVLKFWKGGFRGLDENGFPYENGITAAISQPDLITTSPEVATVAELVTWCGKDYGFNNNFVLSSSTATGAVVAGDLTTLSGNRLFAGGSQTQPAGSVDAVLDAVKNLDYTHILSLNCDSAAAGTNNLKYLAHVVGEAKYTKFVVIGGGHTSSDLTTSISAAGTLNSSRAIVVHAGCQEIDSTIGSGLRMKKSSYKAAYVLGRTAGLSPQTPPTFKALGFAGDRHTLSEKELIKAQNAGVLTTRYDSEIGAFVITQGINTMQNNDFIVNADGTSHLWSLMRIIAQLNKLVEINAKVDILGNQSSGPNRSTVSQEVLKSWVKSFLLKQTATPTQDNLILSFEDVIVTLQQDSYCVSYRFTPNSEINKLFFTSIIIE